MIIVLSIHCPLEAEKKKAETSSDAKCLQSEGWKPHLLKVPYTSPVPTHLFRHGCHFRSSLISFPQGTMTEENIQNQCPQFH